MRNKFKNTALGLLVLVSFLQMKDTTLAFVQTPVVSRKVGQQYVIHFDECVWMNDGVPIFFVYQDREDNHVLDLPFVYYSEYQYNRKSIYLRVVTPPAEEVGKLEELYEKVIVARNEYWKDDHAKRKTIPYEQLKEDQDLQKLEKAYTSIKDELGAALSKAGRTTTYYLIDKNTGQASGPMSEVEFLAHPDVANNKVRWKSVPTTQQEYSRGLEFFGFCVFAILLLICASPFILIFVALKILRKKTKATANDATAQ